MEKLNTDIAKVREIIDDSPKAIEAEFAKKNGNSWLACYGTRVFLLDCYLPEEYRDRLEDVKIRLQALHADHPEYGSQPTDEVKTGMIQRLDVLADDYPELLPREY